MGVDEDDQGPEKNECRDEKENVPIKSADCDQLCFVRSRHICAGSTYLVAAKGFRTDEAQQEQHIDNASTSRPHEHAYTG